MRIITFDRAHAVQQRSVANAFFHTWADVMDVCDESTCLMQLQSKFNGRPNVIFIAESATSTSSNDVIATVSIDTANFSGCSPMIGNIYTHPDHRGLGHGTAMLRHAENQLAKTGFLIAYLWCFPELEGFYAARGWYKIQDHTITGKPAIIMATNVGDQY